MKNNLRKSLSVVSLVMCMLIAMLPADFYAVENESVEELTTEVPENAIYLSTEEDLLELVENCRVDAWSVGKVIVLKNDIELSNTNFQGIPTFGGVFLGQGYTIKGLYIEGEGSVMGFFRYLQETAIVSNLNLTGTVIPEGSRCVVGGLAGENAGIILNCTFDGLVAGSEQIGGIVGKNRTTGVIENTKVSGTVYGNHFIGGIVGENHGVIRSCENLAEVNTQSIQNNIAIEDITLESLVNTEVSNNATDIGGIAGISSGVIRSCVNQGAIGYKNMGYNVGGIAGSQKGYIVDCINYADIQGRKEVGGIVGQMEPNMVLDYDTDSLQMLSSQLNAIEGSINSIQQESESSDNDSISNAEEIQNDLDNIQDALNALNESRDTEKINTYLEDLEDVENWDEDRIAAAENDLSASLDKAYADSENAWVSSGTVSQNTWNQMENIVKQTENMVNTMGTIDSNLGYSIKDTSDKDTPEDTMGKIANSVNKGTIKGERNIGGIVGVMADETDLDAYQDTEISGSESLNATFEVRNVIRGCKNQAKVSTSKQNAGGIVGQMIIGSVLECVNMGNIDALNADYVGGIAGVSYSLIRDCSSRAIISGDTYVGGIAGNGNEVTGCYSFTDIKAYTEKGGAILGDAATLPTQEESKVLENYYVAASVDVGGIDGISYAGATDKLSVEEFLTEDIAEEFRTAKVTFLVEGQNSVVINVNIGESISMDRVPELSTENATEFGWEVVSPVTSEVLGMGETAKVEYLSEESLTNILFDQTYEAVFDTKGTVVKGQDKNENNLAVILAEGIFARNTTIDMIDMLASEEQVDGKNPIVYWNVKLSNTGVKALHYLIPEDVDVEKIKVFVKDNEENWTEKEFEVEASYIVFDFSDEDNAFAVVDNYLAIAISIVKLAAIVVVVIAVIVIAGKVAKKKRNR